MKTVARSGASGYPVRILPVSDAADKEPRKRSLTNLCNTRPASLQHARRALAQAVACG